MRTTNPLKPQWLRLTASTGAVTDVNFAADACHTIEPSPDGVGTLISSDDHTILVQEDYDMLMRAVFPDPPPAAEEQPEDEDHYAANTAAHEAAAEE